MPIRAKLISPVNLLLERPMFQPVAEAEFIVCGKQEFEKEKRNWLLEGFYLGCIAGAIFFVLLVALFTARPAHGQELPPAQPPDIWHRQLPPLPKSAARKTTDWKFVAVVGGLGAAHSADYVTTQRQPWGNEQNPLLGRNPSNLRLSLTGGGFFAGESLLAWRLKNSHSWVRHLWWIEPAASAVIGGRAAARNARAYDRRQCWIQLGLPQCLR